MTALLRLAACVVALASATVLAQPYPSRPIRLVVPFPAGGTADQVARTVAEPLAGALGQAIVIENKPGADGAVAGDYVRKSAPDGYTLFFATNTPLNAAPALRKSPPYDPIADFTPIARLGSFATFVVVSNDVPARSMGELVAYARANPGKVNYGSGNTQSILATALLQRAEGLELVHVPYKGDVQALPDLVTGRIQLMFVTGVAVPHVKDGKVRALAAMLPARTPLLPEVPTLAEAGIASVAIAGWAGLFGPAGLPREFVERLARETKAVLERKDVREALDRLGFAAGSGTPEEMAAFLAEQLALWRRTVAELGIERD